MGVAAPTVVSFFILNIMDPDQQAWGWRPCIASCKGTEERQK